MKAVAEHVTSVLRSNGAPIQLIFAKGRFCFTVKSKVKLLLLDWGDSKSVLRLLGFKKEQCEKPHELSLKAPKLLADDGATIDDDYPLNSQRIRADASFAKLQQSFKKMTKRESTYIGSLRDGTEVKVQDGHVLMCDYLFSLAYFALVRVDPEWDQPGKSMLRSLEESKERLKGASSSAYELLKNSSISERSISASIKDPSPLKTVFEAILKELAKSKPRPVSGSNSKPILKSYDISKILCELVLKEQLECAKEETQADKDEHCAEKQAEANEDPLYYIFEQKILGEREAATTTDSLSWYTETDRNIHMLLNQHRHQGSRTGGGAGCIWGQMVLMRVYDNQENMTMQTILRDALHKLGLARGDNVESSEVRAFSVLSDISKTVIADDIEPYFLNHDLRRACNVSEEKLWGFDSKGAVTELPLDGSKRTLAQILAAKKKSYQEQTARGLRMPRAELAYEDLHNLPLLLIVTEKARMGDTFPHSLASLDLRMRTGGTLTSFVQELGRMCRYPSTRQLPIPYTLDQLRGDKKISKVLTDELPLMIVKANGGDRDIVCHILRDHDLRDDRNFPDCRAGEKFDVHVYFDRLPRAIIREDVQSVLIKGISVKENQSPKASTLQCVNMKLGLDSYMVAAKGKTDTELVKDISIKCNPLHTYHENFVVSSQKTNEKSKGVSSANDDERSVRKTPHYDALIDNKSCPPEHKHERRMVLYAECQIGKTGAYLHFLTRLREEIRGGWVPEFEGVLDQESSWHFPYWHKLAIANSLDYTQPKQGHYYEKVAKQRWAYLQQLAIDKDNAGWLSKYCEWLKSPKGELIVSRIGLKKIENLQNKFDNPSIPVKSTGVAESGAEHEEVPKACINWDGRMEQLSVFGNNLAQLKQPGYNAAHAVWDNPAMQRGGTQKVNCNTTNAQGMMAKHEPPLSTSGTAGKWSEGSLKAEKYGNGAELLSKVRYRLYLPSGNDELPNMCRWIFTCSYGGPTKVTCRLNRESAMETGCDKHCAQVLVVRDDDNLNSYVTHWGSTYIVAVLPSTMEVRYATNSSPLKLTVEDGGIGYARLFCQLFAYSEKIDEIWMLDDNVERCWTIETE
ncbi:MAG: hypothetical protein SGPRY_011339, partial [Prymnesium sp.]